MTAGERGERWIPIRVAALRLALVAALGLALVAAPGAIAASFSGSCSMIGTVSYDPAITVLPASGLDVARASGSCSGRFTADDGRQDVLRNAAATLSERQLGLIWCVAGTSRGSGVLAFRDGEIRFTVSEQRGPGLAALELHGDHGGRALGGATLEPPALAAAALACTGRGLSTAPIVLSIATLGALSG